MEEPSRKKTRGGGECPDETVSAAIPGQRIRICVVKTVIFDDFTLETD